MNTRRRLSVLALAAALSLSAACGQKAGVDQLGSAYAGGQVPGYVDPSTGLPVAPGAPVAPGGKGGQAAPVPGLPGAPLAPGANPAAPGANPSGAPTPGQPPTQAPPAAAGDRTGVTDNLIKIGIHAPVTGAAAIPQQSFQKAVGTYFTYINNKGGINGRKIQWFFEDDQFSPDTARSKCKGMAEQEKVFLIIGGAGADQIDACARYAATKNVPYVSPGVHEVAPGLGSLGSLPTYFALSLTYEQQVPLLARVYQRDYSGQKVLVLTADNANLDNYHAHAAQAVQSAAGGSYIDADRIPKTTDSEALSVATMICNSGAKVVVWNASPSSFLNVVKTMPCTVAFIGPGLTNGLNIVATAGCPNIAGSQFYSPMPGMDVMRQNSEFVNAYRSRNGSEPDDIGAVIYGVEKLVGAMLTAAGKDLTREGFMAAAARQRVFQTGIFPATDFRSRFGGTAMHLLQVDCGAREWRTKRMNDRG